MMNQQDRAALRERYAPRPNGPVYGHTIVALLDALDEALAEVERLRQRAIAQIDYAGNPPIEPVSGADSEKRRFEGVMGSED